MSATSHSRTGTTGPPTLRQEFVDIRASGWLAARRHGVPARMVAEAGARRRAGDWLGACAAARFAVRFTLSDVRQRFGAEVCDAVEDDLRHLAPDLVRWHLPRRWNGGPGLFHGVLIPLATYGAGALWVRTQASPIEAPRPQQPELGFGPVDLAAHDFDSWVGARYLWDVRAAPALLHRLGGGHRLPFFDRAGRRLAAAELPTVPPVDDPVALVEWVTLEQDAGRFAEAWSAAGVSLRLQRPFRQRWPDHPGERGRAFLDGLGAVVPVLVPSVRRLLAESASTVDTVVLGTLPTGPGIAPVLVAIKNHAGELVAGESPMRAHDGLRALPRTGWQRFPDLELLRTGRLTPAGLHPLVRAAMFPDLPGPGDYRPGGGVADLPAVRIRCSGTWHRIGWRDNRVTPLDHTPAETRREAVVSALGGQTASCYTMPGIWSGTGPGHLPRRLRQLRTRTVAAIMHGDTDELLRLLDLGVDPAGLLDRWGGGPLHHLAKIDGVAALGPLLAAGLDLNERDRRHRTPLGAALFDGGSAELIRAMLDAGADPMVIDGVGLKYQAGALAAPRGTMLHLVRSVDGEAIVPWLVAAGVDLEHRDAGGRTALMAQIRRGAPVETIRATMAAGADLTAEYDDWESQIKYTVLVHIRHSGRDDLDFVVAAVERARGS